jgi:hypothetical protein
LRQEPSGRWLARSHSYAWREASRSPQTLSAIAHSTWFQASTWPSGHPIAPSGCWTAAMA